MPRILAGGFVFSLAAALLSGCGTTDSVQRPARGARSLAAPKASASRTIAIPELPEQAAQIRTEPIDQSELKIAQAHAHYGAAVIHEMNEEPEAALNEYYLAALNDPANEPLLLDVTRKFLQRKQPEKALGLLTRSAERPDASGAIYARLGLAYGHLGKTEQALNANRTAIKRSPQLLAGYQNLFVTLLQNKKLDEALKVADEAARQTDVGPEFLAGVAELYSNYVLQAPSQKAKVLERALELLERAEKFNSPDAMLQLRLAETYNLLGAGARAAKIYLELLKKLPDVPVIREQLHAKLADIYLRDRDRTNALEQLQAVVRNDPTNPQAHYWLGYLIYGDKKPEEAIEHFSKAILLKPDFAEAYYHLALAQLSAGKPAEALRTLDSARGKFPQTFLLEFYSGLACGEQKDYAAALRHFNAAEVVAKATQPKLLDKEFYFQLGACYERTGNYARAEEYFQKCLELAPEWADACNYLGYMWAERGINLEKARVLIEKAVKAEPKNAAYLDSLAWVLYKLNQPEEGIKLMLQAIELSPKPDPTLYDHLGDIYMALKQEDQAREAWKKAVSLEHNEAIQKKLDAAGEK